MFISKNFTVFNIIKFYYISLYFIFRKYERCKVIIEGYKNNEDTFQNAIDQYEAAIKKQDEKYQSLKAHAMAQIEKYLIFSSSLFENMMFKKRFFTNSFLDATMKLQQEKKNMRRKLLN